MTRKDPSGNHIEFVREFDLRYINSATKFGEKNPNENGKFLSSIFINISRLIAIISERKFLELLH